LIVDPAIVPGLLLLAAKLAALAAVGYVVVRAALRQSDERMALAQGLVVGPALWGLTTNFVLYAVPGLAGAAVGHDQVALPVARHRRDPAEEVFLGSVHLSDRECVLPGQSGVDRIAGRAGHDADAGRVGDLAGCAGRRVRLGAPHHEQERCKPQ